MSKQADNRVRPYPHFKFPDEIIITVEKMGDEDCKWHGVAKGSYEVRTKNYGWFPSEVLMGTINGRFSDTHNIGANNGLNMGTAGIAVMDIDKAITMLNVAGYKDIERVG